MSTGKFLSAAVCALILTGFIASAHAEQDAISIEVFGSNQATVYAGQNGVYTQSKQTSTKRTVISATGQLSVLSSTKDADDTKVIGVDEAGYDRFQFHQGTDGKIYMSRQVHVEVPLESGGSIPIDASFENAELVVTSGSWAEYQKGGILQFTLTDDAAHKMMECLKQKVLAAMEKLRRAPEFSSMVGQINLDKFEADGGATLTLSQRAFTVFGGNEDVRVSMVMNL